MENLVTDEQIKSALSEVLEEPEFIDLVQSRIQALRAKGIMVFQSVKK
jgi:hypothetical protein